MKRILLLYPYTTPRASNAFGWFREAAGKCGVALEIWFWGRPGVGKWELEDEDGHILPVRRILSVPTEYGADGAPLPAPAHTAAGSIFRGTKVDGAILRGYNSGLSMLFEIRDIPVLNGCAGMELSRDKLLTARMLERCGVPTPRTLFYGESASGEVQFPYAPPYGQVSGDFSGRPFVMKQIFGSKGENVFLIRSAGDYASALEQCRRTYERRMSAILTPEVRDGWRDIGRMRWSDAGSWPDEVRRGCGVIFQEYVASSHGRDIRVWVLGGRVLGQVLRYSAGADERGGADDIAGGNSKNRQVGFRSNFAQGGSAVPVGLPGEAADMAVAAARAVGLTFAGVDLLFAPDGHFTVCEVNGCPGFRTLSLTGSATDIPLELVRWMA